MYCAAVVPKGVCVWPLRFTRSSLLPRAEPFGGPVFRYLLAFGSNQGDRWTHAHRALALLSDTFVVLHSSSWILTPPLTHPAFDTSDHEDYLNFVCEVQSPQDPETLYASLCQVEDVLGHDRVQRWRPRAMDIDILFAAEQVEKVGSFLECLPLTRHSSLLTIPHPGVWQRPFLGVLLEEMGYSIDSFRYYLRLRQDAF